MNLEYFDYYMPKNFSQLLDFQLLNFDRILICTLNKYRLTKNHIKSYLKMSIINIKKKKFFSLMPLKDLFKEFYQLNLYLKSVTETQNLQTLLHEIRQQIFGRISIDSLRIRIPTPAKDQQLFQNPLFASIYCHQVGSSVDPFYEASIFGFLKSGGQIPLHDHPHMYGFIKPLSGRFSISSFSWLNSTQEAEFLNKKNADTYNINSQIMYGKRNLTGMNIQKKLAKFEGGYF